MTAVFTMTGGAAFAIMFIPFFIVAAIFTIRYNRNFITRFVFNNDWVEIVYADKNEVLTIADKRDAFRFTVKTSHSKIPYLYLVVYYKGKLLLKQRPGGEWKDGVFRELKLLTKEKAWWEDMEPPQVIWRLTKTGWDKCTSFFKRRS